MIPGRDLDALIAQKVFEVGVDFASDGEPCYPRKGIFPSDPIPLYSTNIAAAWDVVAQIQRLNPGTVIETKSYSPNHFGIRVIGPKVFYEEAETAPHAICLAALKALGHPLT